jgi:hypothetical protein
MRLENTEGEDIGKNNLRVIGYSIISLNNRVFSVTIGIFHQ